ncbi:hypothetical protein EVAR_67179_1 [Eumeta japonica]|uniref:Uncharacterized protein n=1 Tax=Eumeta variegata TaxID=151549 RepID=A0A4C1ZYS9_EUMVA|nr:hypothetical protein EVAR_67179_1 [Eumeta japonica]
MAAPVAGGQGAALDTIVDGLDWRSGSCYQQGNTKYRSGIHKIRESANAHTRNGNSVKGPTRGRALSARAHRRLHCRRPTQSTTRVRCAGNVTAEGPGLTYDNAGCASPRHRLCR